MRSPASWDGALEASRESRGTIDMVSDEEILAKFEGFAAIMRAVLSQYEQVPDQIIPYQQEITSPREHFFWLSTLDNGIRNMRANLEWAENVIDQIKAGKVPQK